MTKVKIDPGICGFVTSVSAHSDDSQNVAVDIKSGCEGIRKIADKLRNNTVDAYAVCLSKPGEGQIYDLAKEFCPPHTSCPVLSGILKCIEVECKLALKKEVSIHFEE